MSKSAKHTQSSSKADERALVSLIQSIGALETPEGSNSAPIESLARLLADHRLHALVTTKSSELGPHLADLDQGPELIEMLAAARQSLRLLALRDTILEKGLADALRALELAGIQPVILKGRALALTVYDDPWHRPHSDVDLLIDAGDVAVTQRVLDSAGFALPHGIRGQFTSHQFLYSRELAAGVQLHLDVHWKLSNRHQFAEAITYSEARRRAQSICLHGVTHRIVSFEDALLHALIHLYAHHHDEFQPAIWLYDIYLLIEQLTDAQLLALLRRAQSAGASSVAKRGIERAVAACGTTLSDQVRIALSTLPEDESEAFFEMSRIDEIRSDLRVIRSPTARAQYLAEVAFPPASSMLERYGYRARLLLPVAYTRRTLEALARLNPTKPDLNATYLKDGER